MRASLYGSLNTWPSLCTWVFVSRDVALFLERRRSQDLCSLNAHVGPSLSRVTLDPGRFRLSSRQQTVRRQRGTGNRWCNMRGGLFPRWEQWKSNFVAYTVIGRSFPVLPHPLVSVARFFHHRPYVSFSSLPIVSPRRFLSSLHSPSFYVLIVKYGVYGESLWKRWVKSVSRTFLPRAGY